MKNLLFTKIITKLVVLYLGILIGAIALLLSLNGCTDTCQTTTTYKTFRAVYSTMTELRAEVAIMAPQLRETQGKIYVYGNYLLLGDPGKGIHVFDNSNKSNPVAISFINIPGNADMAVKDGRLYADSYVDLLVFDMIDPTNITLANRLEGTFPSYNNQFGFSAEGDRIITAMEELDVIEVSNNCTTNPQETMFWEGDIFFSLETSANRNPSAVGIGGSTARFTIVDDYLYTIDDYNMHVFNISMPDTPIGGTTIDLGWGIETIFPFKNNLFIGSRSGMSIYSLDNPSSPQFMSSVNHVTTCDPVVANDNYAFVTLRSENGENWCGTSFTNELDVIDISDVSNTKILHIFNMTSPHGLGIDGNTLFITEGDDGLKIFDISDVSKIDEHMIQHLTGFNAFDVIPFNGTLILTGNDGLYQFDYTNLDEIKLLSLIPATKW